MQIEYLILLLIGSVAGVLSGLFGIGGGVVIVPSLIYFLGFSLTKANGTSLAALLMPVGIFAVLTYWKAGYLRVKTSALIALGIVIGVIFGSKIAFSLPASTLKQLYGIFLIYVSIQFTGIYEIIRIKLLKLPPSESHPENENYNIFAMIALGIFAGVLSGLFGIGGGLIIVPALIGIFHYPTKLATAASLGALLLPVGLPGVILYYDAGQLDIITAAIVALGIVIGSIVGAKIAINLPSKVVKQYFGAFLMLVAIDFIFFT
jgi:hypothetical protein